MILYLLKISYSMKRKTLLFLFAIILPFMAKAQDNSLQRSGDIFDLNRNTTMESSIKYWSDGALSLDDFSSRRNEFPKILEFKYGIMWDNDRFKIKNTVFVAPVLRCYMDPYSSWIHP